MLELKNIKKTYRVGDIETRALDDVSVSFRSKEFVAILGPSGSGKTTALNIIGGLDRYDSGDLKIKGKSTKKFTEAEWDAYRNNSVGFVFQNYNLISHIGIIANVELGMTLSGVSSAEKRERAISVLKEVGLGDHLHKKPNQLSGGQMQRVAIARALANNPEILLCDEPTGALDTATSMQILDIIKKISVDRLVIMVTHNPELAEKYADRIVKFADGKIISDSHPHEEGPKDGAFTLKKTSMSFFTALNLSFNNIKTKPGRTFLTSFASSIGIIGIALIMSLSSGFQSKVDEYQADALSEFPIIISRSAMNLDKDVLAERGAKKRQEIINKVENNETSDDTSDGKYPNTDYVVVHNPEESKIIHKNNLTDDYIEYLNAISPDICKSIGFTRIVSMNLLRSSDGEIKQVSIPIGVTQGQPSSGSMMSSMNNAGLSSFPKTLSDTDEPYLQSNYDLLAGGYPKDEYDLVLIVDDENRVDSAALSALGYTVENVDKISFSDIVGTEMKIIPNDIWYKKTEYGNYLPEKDYDTMYASEDAVTIRICGILRQKKSVQISLLGNGIAYSDELAEKIGRISHDSEIVKAQLDSDTNVFTMQPVNEDEKKNVIMMLGGDYTPYMIFVYPRDFETKEAVTEYLDWYNDGKDEANMVIYTDLAKSLSDLTKGIIDGIAIVLIAFAAISLVVSLIMICIITYTSVLERTKEIGILKALGARRKDITRVFDAETCIIGTFSGTLGIAFAYLLTLPANAIIFNLTSLKNVATLRITDAVFLILISTVLTMLGGHVPAKLGSKKDAVEALRSE
ncbi:Vitamin B12 import ATP-binding protein BtuD [bioreactor metagenome]|uniref:Vitamin B12 import ATP-binding protein BtuD n=1 Tax=bioreactor metagenome TaxID=1076179 RepID=A0A644YN64_9ZZZZ|nr:ABC transporter ATP-binding protein/permease [Oscillospiraceae bacterium]